jgi:hypothetical protein
MTVYTLASERLMSGVFFHQSFFADRFFSLFDKERNGRIEISALMEGLRTMAEGTPQQKIKFVFDVYDIDGEYEGAGLIGMDVKEIHVSYFSTELLVSKLRWIIWDFRTDRLKSKGQFLNVKVSYWSGCGQVLVTVQAVIYAIYGQSLVNSDLMLNNTYLLSSASDVRHFVLTTWPKDPKKCAILCVARKLQIQHKVSQCDSLCSCNTAL